MRYENVDTKNIIHSKAKIDEDSRIISANEDFYKFVGPTIVYLTDAIHQVDMDDFLYVFENLALNETKNMVLRIRRFDNTFRWVLALIEKRAMDSDNSVYLSVDLSDIINLNNHYMALTKVFENDKMTSSYKLLEDFDKGYDYAKDAILANTGEQVIMLIFSLNDTKTIEEEYGRAKLEHLLDLISMELSSYIGSRGKLYKKDDDKFFAVLKNIGDEKNIRSFLMAAMSQLSWIFKTNDDDISGKFTVGLAETPRNGRDFDIIYKKLLKAYKIAVDKNRNCYVIYKEELHGEIN